MTGLIENVRKLLHDDQGVTSVEYVVMLALIIGALIGTIGAMGDTGLDIFKENNSQIIDAIGP